MNHPAPQNELPPHPTMTELILPECSFHDQGGLDVCDKLPTCPDASRDLSDCCQKPVGISKTFRYGCSDCGKPCGVKEEVPWYHVYTVIIPGRMPHRCVWDVNIPALLAEQDRRTRETCVEAVLKKMDLDDCPPASVVIAAIRNMKA